MRASGLAPSCFKPFSLTTTTPEAPSQIWLALAAVGSGDLHRHDLVLEMAGLGCRDRALVAVVGVLVELVPGEPVFLGHHLRAGELAEHDVRIALLDARALVMAVAVLGGKLRGEAHGHAGHRFHAGS